MEKSVMLDHDFQYKPDKEKNAWSVRISHTHTHTHSGDLINPTNLC